MSRAEEYLDSVTICPNEGFVDVTDALEAVRIVREEVIEKAWDWIEDNMLSSNQQDKSRLYYKQFENYMKGE